MDRHGVSRGDVDNWERLWASEWPVNLSHGHKRINGIEAGARIMENIKFWAFIITFRKWKASVVSASQYMFRFEGA